MYLMNSDGTINTTTKEGFNPIQTNHVNPSPAVDEPHNSSSISSHPHEEIKKEGETKENFSHRRHHNCNCTTCWKNFIVTTIFYVLIIYIIYLISKFLMSDNQESKIDAVAETAATAVQEK